MPEKKERGTLLTIWLFLMLLANSASALVYAFIALGFIAMNNVPLWAIYAFFMMSIFNVILTLFLFRWKKWPFFAFCGIAAAAFIINLAIGVSTLISLFGLLGPVILYLLLRPKWALLE